MEILLCDDLPNLAALFGASESQLLDALSLGHCGQDNVEAVI
jgi:hypothetical protein